MAGRVRVAQPAFTGAPGRGRLQCWVQNRRPRAYEQALRSACHRYIEVSSAQIIGIQDHRHVRFEPLEEESAAHRTARQGASEEAVLLAHLDYGFVETRIHGVTHRERPQAGLQHGGAIGPDAGLLVYLDQKFGYLPVRAAG